jgi:RNA polymerase sigma-70 factor (ECF subfamily)
MQYEKDKVLIQRTLAGERNAFNGLVERYTGLVYGIVLSILPRPDDAEDLVQETFFRAYDQLPFLRRPEKFSAWLGRIAPNLSCRWLQREQRRRQVEQVSEPLIPHAGPAEQIEAKERAALLQQALSGLAPELRRVVLLYHMEGYSYRQIARFLDTPLATVRWRLLQSERKLGRHFEKSSGTRQHGLLIKRILASLAGSALWTKASQAGPWWAPAAFLPMLEGWGRRTAFFAFFGSLILHIAGVGLTHWLPGKITDESALVYWPVNQTAKWIGKGIGKGNAPALEYLPPKGPEWVLERGDFNALSTPSMVAKTPFYKNLDSSQPPFKRYQNSQKPIIIEELEGLREYASADSITDEGFDYIAVGRFRSGWKAPCGTI